MFPDIGSNRAGNRKEELLGTEDELNKIWILRKVLAPLASVQAMDLLREKILGTKSNKEFLKSMELSNMVG